MSTKEESLKHLQPFMHTLNRVLHEGFEEFLFIHKPQFKSVFPNNYSRASVLHHYFTHRARQLFAANLPNSQSRVISWKNTWLIIVKDAFCIRIKTIDEDCHLRSQSERFADYCHQEQLPGVDIQIRENLILAYNVNDQWDKLCRPSLFKPNGLRDKYWEHFFDSETNIQPKLIDQLESERPKKTRFVRKGSKREKSEGQR